MDNARVVAFDTHEKLLTDCDTYRTFCESAVASRKCHQSFRCGNQGIWSIIANILESKFMLDAAFLTFFLKRMIQYSTIFPHKSRFVKSISDETSLLVLNI